MLYDSLQKLLAFEDATEVWPAHGAGSACGRNISKERSSTIGEQRRVNYALKPMPRDEFVALMTRDLPPAPRYFPMDAEINRRGARPLSEVDAPKLDAPAVRREIANGALVLDVRPARDFAAGHISGSLNIGLDGEFASWAGTLLSPDERLIIVSANEVKSREAVVRLARVGLETVCGVIADGLASWDAPLATMTQLPAADLSERLASLTVVDVRRRAEFASGHVPGARNIPLDELPARLGEVPPDGNLAVICAGGYRSSIAASLMARSGIPSPLNVSGGTQGWMASRS
jgi:rhodanese-related sulfurtransferase